MNWDTPKLRLVTDGPAPAQREEVRRARLRYRGATDCGLRRCDNQDAFLADPRLGLFVVCDGVGGRAHGELASAVAVDVIREQVRRASGASCGGPQEAREDAAARLGAVVRGAVEEASRRVHALAASDPRYHGMSTTASVVLVAGGLAVVGQVGDSRVYHARGEAVRQVTEDHTLAAVQARLGQARPAAAGRKSPITRALGLRAGVEVDVGAVPLLAGDRLLLCSDGLHDHFEAEATLRRLFALDVRAAATEAIDHARRCGGGDNITALFVEILGAADLP